jgi:acyl carrier protein
MINDILHKIKSLLHQSHEHITAKDSLVLSGLLSSFKIIELATWLEKKYAIDFSKQPFNIYDFETATDIQKLINELGKK